MTEKLKASRKALIVVISAIVLALVMAMSSRAFPESLPGREMVTASPRASEGEQSSDLTLCVRCAGTDCVIWLPSDASVSGDKIFGRKSGLTYLILSVVQDSFNDNLRERILGELYEPVAGSRRGVSVARSETGYLGLEKVGYEELLVRTKVSLRTQKNYIFAYLIVNGSSDCDNTCVVVAAERRGEADAARDLLIGMAGSYQRFGNQRREVQEVLFNEAVLGGDSQETLLLEENSQSYESQKAATPEKELVIDSVISLGRQVQPGDVLVFMYENDFEDPTTLQVKSPSGTYLDAREGNGGGFYAFDVTESDGAEGWHIEGSTKRELGIMVPMLLTAEEYEAMLD